jgi:sugar phosphate isomerase/epimerase
MSEKIAYSVFTKPWKTEPLTCLAEFVSELGFDGIELPVRPGFQVAPENVRRDLPIAAKKLAEFGLKIYSVAGPTDEATIIACAEAGVPVIRTMARIGDEGYLEAEARLQRDYDALVPLLEKYGVTIGVQNHCNRFVANAVGLLRLIGKYDPKHIAAVWDPAHEALNGGLFDLALDAIWSHLCMVNLKNGLWKRTNGPEAEYAEWDTYWTSGRQGLASWRFAVGELRLRGYEGVVCLTAEYSDEEAVERLIAEDLATAKALFA